MRSQWSKVCACVLLLLIESAAAVAVEIQPGQLVFDTHCAACHMGGDPRALKLPTLRALNPLTIEYALTKGKMIQQGSLLDDKDRRILIDWLSSGQVVEKEWLPGSMCTNREVALTGTAYVTHWGIDANNHRYQRHSQISVDNASRLERKWVMAFPGVSMMRSQPAIVGDTMFLAVAELQTLFAIDRQTGCVKWVYEGENPLRSAVAAGQLNDGRWIVYFGDFAGFVHVVDARTGKPLWRKHVGRYAPAIITGGLRLLNDILFVPHSSYEAMAAADPNYECCKSQGHVSAHNAVTGEDIWLARVMSSASPTGKTRIGKPSWGPAGASIWSPITLDVSRRQLLVGTGPISAAPDEGTGDAIISFDMDSGERRWVFQGTAGDYWNGACRTVFDDLGHPNCPTVGWDFDFGAAVILVQNSRGEDVLLAGQKSGHVYAINPDNGKLIWKIRLGDGSVLGGVHWGMTVQDGHLYVPVNDPTLNIPELQLAPEIVKRLQSYKPKPALHKINIDSGEVVWSWEPKRECTPDLSANETWPDCPREIGLSAAPMGIPGAVISGGLDGLVRIHDSRDGSVIFSDNTARPFADTVNGVPGHGGSLDNATTVVAGNMMYVQSGYSMFGGVPGNVLIAYEINDIGEN